MKANEYFAEDKPIVSLQRSRELLPDCKLSDEDLQNVLLNIQQFAEMTYDLYLMQKKSQDHSSEGSQEEHYSIAA